MVKQRCLNNGELNNSNYSSPMPLIGLCMAGATWVCLIFILIDIFSGFRNGKRWLPCRYFSLNSIILTLLAIAAKLPVDLTTSMPSVLDQLSKLTGTVLISTSMSFLVPSLGANSISDCFSNMIALSIFVITVIVNICIQIFTGVIILFRVQHIIIMCCMILLLCGLWYTYLGLCSLKEAFNDGIKDNLKNETLQKGNMLYRLKLCYLFGYSSNLQLTLCKRWLGISSMFSVNILSSVVLGIAVLQSLFDSKKLEICQGSNSISKDYAWSIKIIVISQIFTIVAGCLGDIFRNLFMIGHNSKELDVKDAETTIIDNPILDNPHDSFAKELAWRVAGFMFVLLLAFSLAIPCYVLIGLLNRICKCNDVDDNDDDDECKEFMSLIRRGEFELDEWSLKKGVQDMKKWMETSKTNAATMSNVIQLLTKTPPSQDQTLKNHYDSWKPGYKMSSLTIVVLQKIALISLPSSLNAKSLISSSLKEVFKIIHFVDRKMSIASSFESKRTSTLAEALFQSHKFNSYVLLKTLKRREDDNIMHESESELNKAIRIIKGLKHVLPSDLIRDELCIIADFISDESRHYESIENLCGHIEQLFVDMLNEFLVQLPIAMYKEIVESPPEECEDRVRFVIKLLCEVEQLEGLVQWSFPISSITSFITDDNEVLPA